MHYSQRVHSRLISHVRTRYKDCPKAQGEHKRRSGLLAEQSRAYLYWLSVENIFSTEPIVAFLDLCSCYIFWLHL